MLMCWEDETPGFHKERTHRSSTAPSPDLTLCVSSIWSFLDCILYNETVMVSIMLLVSSVNHSSKLLNLRRSWGPQNLWLVFRSGGGPQDLWQASEVGAVLWRTELLNLWGLMLTLCSSVRTEMNCRTVSGCYRTGVRTGTVFWELCWWNSFLQSIFSIVSSVKYSFLRRKRSSGII